MSWTNYLKKGFASILIIILGLVMLVAFGFNKSFDYTGGSIVSVNARDYTQTEATTMVKDVFAKHQNVHIASFSVGSSKDEKIITVKYQISTDVDSTNAAVKNELFDKFKYDQDSTVEKTFITLTSNIQPAYGSSVFVYALLGALIAALAVAVYLWIRIGLASGISLLAGTIIDVLCGIAMILIFRIEISANIGYAILGIATLSILFNTLMLTKLRANAFEDKNKKLLNSEVVAITRKQMLNPTIVSVGAFAVVLLALSVIGFGPAGSAVFAVALSLASIFVTSLFVMPSLWELAFVRKIRERRKPENEETPIEKEVE